MMTNEEDSDFWLQESFEDTVAKVIIAQYETKIAKNDGAHPKDVLSLDCVRKRFEKSIPYIPSNSRVTAVHYENGELAIDPFDLVNDPLPEKGSLVMKLEASKYWPDAYTNILFFRRVDKVPHHFLCEPRSVKYLFWHIVARNEHGLDGERFCLYVTPDGNVKHARLNDIFVNGQRIDWPVFQKNERANSGLLALNTVADKRFCWSIVAKDGQANVELGCMQEEIKSLLYARSLPLTATGRKRPVLHLVAAHRRRIKEGIDIDISQYLRGTSTVEMNGTQFTICPPQTLGLTKN